MDNKKDILNELQAISPLLADMEKINVFSIPPGYFQDFSMKLMELIKHTSSQPINNSSGNVPPGYFDTLADSILDKIKRLQLQSAVEEIQKLSPLLYPLQSINVFKVPPGYFNHTSNEILQKVYNRPLTKIVRLQKYSSFLKYAVAAIFMGAMALGVFKFTHTNLPGNTTLPQYVVEGEKIQNIDEELAKINDSDIVKYLQDNDEEVDAALVINTLDDKELPTEEDYLIDEQALDNYLNNLNFNNSKN
jgi:hypothetical protein